MAEKGAVRCEKKGFFHLFQIAFFVYILRENEELNKFDFEGNNKKHVIREPCLKKSSFVLALADLIPAQVIGAPGELNSTYNCGLTMAHVIAMDPFVWVELS